MELSVLLAVAVMSLIVYLWFRRPDPHLPPSPMRPLPIVGHLLYMASDFRPQFKKWRKQCGDIYSLYMGGTLVVVLNGYDLIKEALVQKADVFSDRPPSFLDQATRIPNKGVVSSSGTIWKEQRSVSLSILRSFGMGKNLLAEKIQEIAGCYVKHLAELNGKPTDIRIMTNISTCNVICSILIGHHFEYDDKDFQDLMHNMESIATDAANVGLVNFFPWLRHLPGDLFKAKRAASSVQAVMRLLSNFIKQKRRQVEDASDVCNLIDAYIIERQRKLQTDSSTTMDDQHLAKIMFELFVAGTETTSTTIYWCILYMLHNPEVQEKVYQEIKDKIGTDRTPTLQDRTQLTYLIAVINETQRLVSIVPLALPHMCSEEVTLRDYTLPKGTSIIPNLDSVLHDKTTWGDDVMSFRPERFIDDSGKLKIPEQFIPFGIGHRICLGEAMANMELFLFLSSKFQRFRFLPPTPSSVPPLKYICGININPKPYEVRAVARK